MMGKHAERMNAILATTEDNEEFALNYFKLLEYIQPKLQRTEIETEEQDVKLTIEYVESTADKESRENSDAN